MTHIEAKIHKALQLQREDRDARYRAERADRKPTLSLSGIGDCSRKLWAGLHGIESEPMSGHLLATFAMGDAVERLVIELLNRADYQIHRRQERVVIDFGDELLATGRLDGVFIIEHGKFSQEDAVLEIKSANREQFEKCEALGYDAWRPTYGDTLHAYMGASKLDVAVAVVFCKDNSRIYAEKIRFDAKRYERLCAKAEAVLRAERPVPRPEKANGQYSEYCKFCPVSEWCYSSTADVRFDS